MWCIQLCSVSQLNQVASVVKCIHNHKVYSLLLHSINLYIHCTYTVGDLGEITGEMLNAVLQVMDCHPTSEEILTQACLVLGNIGRSGKGIILGWFGLSEWGVCGGWLGNPNFLTFLITITFPPCPCACNFSTILLLILCAFKWCVECLYRHIFLEDACTNIKVSKRICTPNP